ncbi:hypothetical protein OG984_19490 [Nocardioides sp. NBC_00368]|uniref:hypothetical protein n=1 Tax=Nocardioides sp. NBC_00368 TaxID=2976000 RepID=UPI002E1E6D03
MGETATVLVIAVVAIGLVVASLLRRARRSECLVVTRHRRIVRLASDSMTVAIPGFHEVLEWLTGPDGLYGTLEGIRIDGLAAGVVTEVVIDEVDLLLHPGRLDDGD